MTSPASSIPLFQYWHSGTPPEEVQRLIAEWRAAPGFDHRLFDHEAAAALIETEVGARAAACFRACAVPAMQSDLFRLAALLTQSGLYLDADNARGPGDFAAFLRTLQVGLLCWRRGKDASDVWFCNDIPFARDPHHPLFARLLDLACDNVEAREGSNVWEATGPWLVNRLWMDRSQAHLFDGFTFGWYDGEMRDYVRPVGELSYNKGQEDWRAFAKDGRSLYR